MKQPYEEPQLRIDWFCVTDIVAASDPTDWIPDTDDDDVFGNL